eukprot:6176395-Pleurochrysis_carterae.AAC.2
MAQQQKSQQESGAYSSFTELRGCKACQKRLRRRRRAYHVPWTRRRGPMRRSTSEIRAEKERFDALSRL